MKLEDNPMTKEQYQAVVHRLSYLNELSRVDLSNYLNKNLDKVKPNANTKPTLNPIAVLKSIVTKIDKYLLILGKKLF
jgi:hypothetical protein